MTMLEEIIEKYGSVLIADGFDDAILGVSSQGGQVIYSIQKCIDILIAEGMSEEDAIEHFYFNVECAYVGEDTPLWCDDFF